MQWCWVMKRKILLFLQMYKATSRLFLLSTERCFLHSQHITNWVKVISLTIFLAYLLLHKFIPIVNREWPEIPKQICELYIQRNSKLLIILLSLAYFMILSCYYIHFNPLFLFNWNSLILHSKFLLGCTNGVKN